MGVVCLDMVRVGFDVGPVPDPPTVDSVALHVRGVQVMVVQE